MCQALTPEVAVIVIRRDRASLVRVRSFASLNQRLKLLLSEWFVTKPVLREKLVGHPPVLIVEGLLERVGRVGVVGLDLGVGRQELLRRAATHAGLHILELVPKAVGSLAHLPATNHAARPPRTPLATRQFLEQDVVSLGLHTCSRAGKRRLELVEDAVHHLSRRVGSLGVAVMGLMTVLTLMALHVDERDGVLQGIASGETAQCRIAHSTIVERRMRRLAMRLALGFAPENTLDVVLCFSTVAQEVIQLRHHPIKLLLQRIRVLLKRLGRLLHRLVNIRGIIKQILQFK
mmetsp:Transcript_25853/g.59632  ORF Transcript_25853/g.59632 Transcript_25853/m.59632 type:complete len:290 (+) Transcript_25853:2087-2956(+)